MIVSYIYADGMASVFTDSLLIIFSIGFLMWLVTVRSQAELSTRDGFLVVTLFWAVLGVAGSLPFVFSSAVELSVTDAVFESLSGLTTTGATVISGLDDLP
ncbi:MAG: potassium transporter TrkG, partial [Gammaproteobacteria bacterium]